MDCSKIFIEELVRLSILPDESLVQSITYFPPAPYGEYDCAIRLSRRVEQNEKEISSELISECKSVGNYLNIKFYQEALVRKLVSFINNFTISDESKYNSKKIAIEHTSITPVYPINLATYRSSVIGEAIKNSLVLAGAQVETHFFVEDMARQFELLKKGVASLDGAQISLRNGDKIDHQIGRVFTTAYVADCKRKDKPQPVAASRLDNMFPMSHPVIIDSLRESSRYTSKELCQICLEGIKQTLEETGIVMAYYDYESEHIDGGFDCSLFKDANEIQTLFVNSSRIPYYLRNCAYFSYMMKNNDMFFTVISDRQRAAINDTLDIFCDTSKINICFFDDVIVNDGETESIDSIKEGVFHSVDQYLKDAATLYAKSNNYINRALKLKILSTNINKTCYIDDSKADQYNACFELLDFYDEWIAADIAVVNDEVNQSFDINLNKHILQFAVILNKTLNELRFDFLANYIFSLFDNIKIVCQREGIAVKNLAIYPAIKKVFDITFEILDVKF